MNNGNPSINQATVENSRLPITSESISTSDQEDSSQNEFYDLERLATKAKIYSLLGKPYLPIESLYKNPNSYDIAYPGFEGDIEFYGNLLHEGNVLYAGIGSGRGFSEMAKLKPNIKGLDISNEMLEQLMEKFPGINRENLIEDDIRDLSGEKFDQIIAPYAFLNVFNPRDLKKAVTSISGSLKPNGQFITDVFSPFNNPPYNQKSEIYRNDSESDGTRILIEIFYDHIRQRLLEITYTKDANGSETLTNLQNHFYFPNELERIFENAGLSTKIYGGYDLSAPKEDSEPLVVIATKN